MFDRGQEVTGGLAGRAGGGREGADSRGLHLPLSRVTPPHRGQPQPPGVPPTSVKYCSILSASASVATVYVSFISATGTPCATRAAGRGKRGRTTW